MSEWNAKSDTYVHRMAETGGAMNSALVGITHGLVAGTNVASNLGWRAVDALSVGDMVLTFDNAMQPIVEIRRDLTWLDAKAVSYTHLTLPTTGSLCRCRWWPCD